MLPRALTLVVVFLTLHPALAGAQPHDPARDAAIVESLMRLPNVNIHQNAKLKDAVLRHLDAQKGTARYVQLIEKFQLKELNNDLLDLAIADAGGTVGVNAVELLLKQGGSDLIDSAINDDDEARGVSVVSALGLVARGSSDAILRPLVTDGERSLAIRATAVAALGRSRGGQNYLLRLVIEGKLTDDLRFAAGNALHASADEQIRRQVADLLPLPTTANQEPLPTTSELTKMAGDHARGKKVFETIGTCNKCHIVAGQGKEVGPDLSEIGSKLSIDAMFVSILDPSAGISHNYEGYSVALAGGEVYSGIVISESVDSVTIRTPEAITRTIDREEIDELVKQSTSLMPSDLHKFMTAQDLVDLVSYLQSLRKSD